MLKIINLKATINDKPILKGVNLTIPKGEIHLVVGPNGSGKSTLANILMGNPIYKLTTGKIIFNNKNINKWDVFKRAVAGIFMVFQHPRDIEGVQLDRFLFMAYSEITKARRKLKILPSVFEFNKNLAAQAKFLEINKEFLTRFLNKGLSGGEKKKTEILQMLILNPLLAVIDEVDSGLDIDALKVVSKAIKKYHTKDNSILLITHYHRILNYIKPDKIHVMIDGCIVDSGGMSLLKKINKDGFSDYVS